MSRRLKSLTATVGALMLTTMLVVLILPFVVDSNLVRARAIALIEVRTGLDVRVDGGVHLQWLPVVRVTATDVRVANPRGFAAKDLARVASLSMTPALPALLRGRLETKRLDLDDVDVHLERDDAGNGNWSMAARALRGGRARAEDDDADAPTTVVLGALNLRDVRFVWRGTHDTTTIANLEAHTGTIDARGGVENLRVRASLPTGEDAPASIVEASGEIVNGRLLQARLDANLLGADAPVRLEGALRGDLHTGRFLIEDAHGESAVGRARTPVRFDAEVVVDADARTLIANALRATLGETPVHGNLELRVDAAVSGVVGTFDLAVEDHPVTGDLALDWNRPAMDVALELSTQLGDRPGLYGLRGRNDIAVRATFERRASEDRSYRVTDLQVVASLTDPSAADGRLRLTLRTDVDIDAVRERILADNLRLEVHDSGIAGFVEVRGFETPAVRFDLEAEAIDADRMLPAIGARVGDTGTTPVRATIEAIRAMDVAGELRVGRLAVRGMRLENVRLLADGGAKGG